MGRAQDRPALMEGGGGRSRCRLPQRQILVKGLRSISDRWGLGLSLSSAPRGRPIDEGPGWQVAELAGLLLDPGCGWPRHAVCSLTQTFRW